jgi:hypothetical protein
MVTTEVTDETQATETSQAPQLNMTVNDAIAKYIALRDRLAEVKKAHDAEQAQYKSVMAVLEGFLLSKCDGDNATGIKTEAGTCYKSLKTGASVRRWSETLDYIRDNERWELLDPRVSKTAVFAIMEETGKPIPGVVTYQEYGLNVRRS